MIITAAECSFVASSNVLCSHASSAGSRAWYSASSPARSPAPLEQRLLHVPCTFTVAYVTCLNVQRRFSTQGSGACSPALFTPRQFGVDCTSSFIVCLPSDLSSLKKRLR